MRILRKLLIHKLLNLNCDFILRTTGADQVRAAVTVEGRREQVTVRAVISVILMVVNGGKMRTKGEQRRRKGFIGFSRNLLISFDYGQLRQVLMKLVVRLLTEGLLVRV